MFWIKILHSYTFHRITWQTKNFSIQIFEYNLNTSIIFEYNHNYNIISKYVLNSSIIFKYFNAQRIFITFEYSWSIRIVSTPLRSQTSRKSRSFEGWGERNQGACQFFCGFISRLAGGDNLLKPALSKTGSRSLTLCPAPMAASSSHLKRWRPPMKNWLFHFSFLSPASSDPPCRRISFMFRLFTVEWIIMSCIDVWKFFLCISCTLTHSTGVF